MREVREEREAEAALNAALERWPRTQDAWETITWVLVHDPDIGMALSESGRIRSFTLGGARSIGLPTVTVVYECLPTVICIHAASFKDADFEKAGRA